MKNKALIGSLALLTFVVFSGPAKATPLPPGTIVPIAPDDFSLTDFSGATLLGSVMTPFVTTLGTTTGTIRAAVFSDPTNVFGAGDLTFVYQIHNNAGSADSLFRGTASDFSSFVSIDVGFTSHGHQFMGFADGTVSPDTVNRPNPSGDTVGFNFVLGLGSGSTSDVLIIETPATEFTSGNFSVIDGGVATVPAFEPTVPDGGTTVALLGIALAGLEGVRRMFRARKS